jgi:hypothetical protein
MKETVGRDRKLNLQGEREEERKMAGNRGQR